ncbi:hypothetical protein AS026_19520 [Rhizobium altiplani]|uniref:Uncharacterized protein n=2 Tax=Rhizobium altiplani TaxID=1864509 RepID=A0A109J7Q4_9HYPH|nr:hypothetical protein AS026_19520 [Rhizobium altiplani]
MYASSVFPADENQTPPTEKKDRFLRSAPHPLLFFEFAWLMIVLPFLIYLPFPWAFPTKAGEEVDPFLLLAYSLFWLFWAFHAIWPVVRICFGMANWCRRWLGTLRRQGQDAN